MEVDPRDMFNLLMQLRLGCAGSRPGLRGWLGIRCGDFDGLCGGVAEDLGLRVPAGEVLRAGDEAGAVGEGEVGPGPLAEDGDAVAESDEEEDVDDEPRHP